jgi:hypothetical protein
MSTFTPIDVGIAAARLEPHASAATTVHIARFGEVSGQVVQTDDHTAHSLIERISFVLIPSLVDLQASTRERLRYMVTRIDEAFNALWTELDNSEPPYRAAKRPRGCTGSPERRLKPSCRKPAR